MRTVSSYLIILLLSLVALLLLTLSSFLPSWIMGHDVVIKCCLTGGFGAAGYCLWAVYYHCCRAQDWDDVWIPWYFIRPILGVIFGGFTYFLVTAGLLVLEATPENNSTHLGIFVLAFIAKVEDLASNLWGIEPSSL